LIEGGRTEMWLVTHTLSVTR